MIKVEDLENKKLEDLQSLKSIIQDVCEDYAKNLTTYATMSADPQFQKMDSGTRDQYLKRGIFVKMLEIVKQAIEKKLLKIYNEEKAE